MFEESDDNLCPLGCKEEETKLHHLRCTKQPGATCIARDLADIKKWMNKTNTAPAIKIALMSGIQTWMETEEDWELTHKRHSTIEEAVEEAAEEQARIGWHELF